MTLRCRLGGTEGAALGSNATLGCGDSGNASTSSRSCWGRCQHAVFTNFLPGAPGLAELHSLVRLYTNDEWEWQVRLLLRDVEIPGARLDGANPLGWTSWLGERRAHAGRRRHSGTSLYNIGLKLRHWEQRIHGRHQSSRAVRQAEPPGL